MRRILVVEQDKTAFDTLTEFLGHENFTFQTTLDLDSTLHRVRAWKPHLVLISMDVEGLDSLGLISKIRSLSTDEYSGILMLSSEMSAENVRKGMDLGADYFLSKPYKVQDIVAATRTILRIKESQDSLRRANHKVEELSSSDDLTGLMNMRSAYRKGEEEIARSRRLRKPVSSLLLNLDSFSHINQTLGFTAGSTILQEVAARIKQCVRAIDLVARVGADEFFILLADTDLAGAEFMAERIRDSIKSMPFKNDKQSVKLTASLGVAGLNQEPSNQRMGDLLHFTSEALKSAKANGSDRIEVYSFT